MRKIYQKYFEIPEENKGIMGEHVFFARLAVSIACIMLCMSALGFSAYAYFTASVTSSVNSIQAANFAVRPEIAVVENSEGSAAHEKDTTWKYTLQSGTYDITLNKEGTASTGYCEIRVGEKSLYTDQIGVIDENGTQMTFRTVRIAVVQETVVEIIACWGTYSGNPICEAEEMIIVDGQEVGIGGKPEVLTTNGTTTPTESATTQKNTTSAETTTPSEATVPTEDTATTEDTASEVEEKKDDTITESIETEDNITTESMGTVDNTTSTDDTSLTETQE